MALEKRTVLDRIEVVSTGHVFVKLLKQVVDGSEILQSEPHRSGFDPLMAVSYQVALINEHLAQMGWPPIDKADIAAVSSHAKVARTPKRVKAWRAKVVEAKAQRDAEIKAQEERDKALRDGKDNRGVAAGRSS